MEIVFTEAEDPFVDIREKYKSYTFSHSDVIHKLKSIGLGEVLAVRAIEKFGVDNVIDIIFKINPYSLMGIEGFGFNRADNIAKQLGVLWDDPRRQKALILHIIENNKTFGHSYLPLTILEKECKKQTVVDYASTILALINDGYLIKDDNRLYLKKLYDAETEVARIILLMITGAM